jgi:hypothetical protein
MKEHLQWLLQDQELPQKGTFKDTPIMPCCGMSKIVQHRDHKQKIFIPEQAK